MATKYKHHGGYYSDFDGANGECAQCGVPTYRAPEIHDDAHPIQMQYEPEGGVFCEACFFDGYSRTGHEIANPEMVTMYHVLDDWRTLYFETWQAASGYARRVDGAEYLGETEIEAAMLEAVEE